MGVRSRSGSDRLRTVWTPEMDRYFIDLMLEQVNKGNKFDDHLFSKRAWKHMALLFNSKFKFQYEKDVLKNRHKTLRNLYKAVKNLLDQRGFNWDETRQMVTAENNDWDEYIKAHPDARSFRIKTIPYYSDLCRIYRDAFPEPTGKNVPEGSLLSSGKVAIEVTQPSEVGDGDTLALHDIMIDEDYGITISEKDAELEAPQQAMPSLRGTTLSNRTRTYWQPPMDRYAKDDVEVHISTIVNITEEGSGHLVEVVCSAWPEEIEIDSVSIRKQENLPAKPYPGPVFKIGWFGALNHFKLAKMGRPFSSSPTTTSSTNKGGGVGEKTESNLTKYDESYRQLDNLDFMTAAKILFTEPPKKKKFGLDFHLVQLFFVLMPSLAVYLVAQYARYEIRRMEQELEQKKKKEDEKKAKELELKAIEEKETGNPELREVKTRLDKLEESLKKIVVESKQPSSSEGLKNNERDDERKDTAETEASSGKSTSESSTSIDTEKEPRGGHNLQEQKSDSGKGKVGEPSEVSNPR